MFAEHLFRATAYVLMDKVTPTMPWNRRSTSRTSPAFVRCSQIPNGFRLSRTDQSDKINKKNCEKWRESRILNTRRRPHRVSIQPSRMGRNERISGALHCQRAGVVCAFVRQRQSIRKPYFLFETTTEVETRWRAARRFSQYFQSSASRGGSQTQRVCRLSACPMTV